MALHIVQPNQSAASIAQAYTGNPAREKELIRANLHKGYRQTANGNLYFTSLQPGERLRIPLSWMRLATVKNPMAKTTNGGVAFTRLQGLVNMHNTGVYGVGVGQIQGNADDGGDSGGGDDGSGSGTVTQNSDDGGGSATTANNTANGSLDANGNLVCSSGYTLAVDGNGNNYCAPNSSSGGGGGVTPGVPVPGSLPVVAAAGTDWLLWGGVALGVVVVGGGLYYFSKKGHHPAGAPKAAPPHKSTEMFYR